MTVGHDHKFTEEEQRRRGSNSGGDFKDDPDQSGKAGKIGGRH